MNQDQNDEYAAHLEFYEKLVETNPEITRKGKTMPYTSLNGHMFSFLSKDGRLNLRLPKGERESFMTTYDTELSVQYGSIMKEYVVVPNDMLENTSQLKKYFKISFDYIQSLKPKPTKKKSK